MKLLHSMVFGCLLWPLAALPAAEAPQNQMPAACTQACINPYGTVLGTAQGNVPAYSNCKIGCVIFEPHYEWEVYTGIKWQCVEYARRWLYSQRGLVFGDVKYAVDIWQDITFYKDPENGNTVPVVNYPNGSSTRPARGDLLIYDKSLFGTGHVAVVTEVDDDRGVVRVAEQNFTNTRWQDNYSREIPLVHKDGHYYLEDDFLLGWKRQKD